MSVFTHYGVSGKTEITGKLAKLPNGLATLEIGERRGSDRLIIWGLTPEQLEQLASLASRLASQMKAMVQRRQERAQGRPPTAAR